MTVAETLLSLRQRIPAMAADLERLVNAESPSRDYELLDACAQAIDEVGSRLLGKPAQRIKVDQYQHLYWSFGQPRVLICAHYDTVWPAHTIDRWPFEVSGDRATGPGAFDMKGGLVESIYALASGSVPDGAALLVTADEEIGSLSSRKLIEELASKVQAVLITEPGHHGAIKTGRKGVSFYEFEITGRAAHAGLEPEKGANALVEMAHRILFAQSLARPDIGTTVNATVGSGGTANNVIPAHARFEIDVRARTREEQERVDNELLTQIPMVADTTCQLVGGGMNRSPFEEKMSEGLYQIARQVAPAAGIEDLTSVVVGGGSDGNFTAAIGIPTLDGLGIVGDGAHAEGEWVTLSSMAERGALVRGIVDEVLANGLS